MNYRHIYMAIICHAKSEEQLGIRKRKNGNYYEKHHILPKSLFPLWKKNKNNCVLLTAREHYFCHQLLTKIYPSRPMFAALWQMSIRTSKSVAKIKITSREYERAKQAWVKVASGINAPSRAFRIAYNKSETKRKQLSEQLKKKFQDPAYHDFIAKQTGKKVCQKVKCLNTNQIFDSIQKASAWCGLASSSHISDCCRGTRKFAGKHPKTLEKLQWEYVGVSYRNSLYTNNSLAERRAQSNRLHTGGKKIKCLETNKVFNSITSAAAWCGISSSCISCFLHQKNLTYAGLHPETKEKLHWQYI